MEMNIYNGALAVLGVCRARGQNSCPPELMLRATASVHFAVRHRSTLLLSWGRLAAHAQSSSGVVFAGRDGPVPWTAALCSWV